MVDLVGIEPTTSSMPWKRAPSCATGPHVNEADQVILTQWHLIVKLSALNLHTDTLLKSVTDHSEPEQLQAQASWASERQGSKVCGLEAPFGAGFSGSGRTELCLGLRNLQK